MKKNAGRLSKKLFAAMMAGTMMTAMIGANVYATGGGSTANPQQNVTITKKITKEAKCIYSKYIIYFYSRTGNRNITGRNYGRTRRWCYICQWCGYNHINPNLNRRNQ